MVDSIVGELVKRRENLGWSQAQLAKLAGLKHLTVKQIESGVRVGRWTTIKVLANTMGLEIELREVSRP